MRLATFNLLHGQPVTDSHTIGGAGPSLDAKSIDLPTFTDVGPLRKAVEDLNPDVLGLQEVDVHQPRSGGHHQVREIAEALDAPFWRFVPTVRGTPGARSTFAAASTADIEEAANSDADFGPRYGIGMVSRVPILSWQVKLFEPSRIPLPLLVQTGGRPRFLKVSDEPRAAIAVEIELDGIVVTVATVHLSFVPGRNVRQLRQLRHWLVNLPRPLILMGDFNLPGVLPRIVSGYSQIVSQPTYPSYKPRVQFDHLLTDGISETNNDAMRRSVRVQHLGVSDHCAVAVDIDQLRQQG